MKGYRTIFFNAGIAALTAGLAHFSPDLLTELAGPTYAPWVVAGVAIVNVLLRTVTSTPVGKAAA